MCIFNSRSNFALWTIVGNFLFATSLMAPAQAQQNNPRQTANSGGDNNQTIVFTSTRDGNKEIYKMDGDGSNQIRLTNNSAADERPAISPDGESVVFASNRTGQWELFEVPTGGGSVTQLTNGLPANNEGVRGIDWHPDGSNIVFSTKDDNESDDVWEIYRSDPDGSDIEVLIDETVDGDELDANVPEYSPSGNQIVMNRNVPFAGGTSEAWISDADGGDMVKLTDAPDVGSVTFVGESGDLRIVHGRETGGGGDRQIWKIDTDGSNAVNLSGDNAPEYRAQGPSGPNRSAMQDQFLFRSNRGGETALWRMNLAGSDAEMITTADINRGVDWWVGSGGPGPPSPTNLSATAGDGQVELTWNAGGSSNPAGYNVYRSTSTFSDVSNATKLNSSLISSTSFSDTNVSDGTTYYYRVTAVDNDGNESSPSNLASASLQNLELLGLEVNQSIQDWQNSVPLIEGKKTVVRAHLQNKAPKSTPVNVRLKGMRDGSSLPESPLEPENSNFEAPPQTEDSEVIAKRRADLDESLNFTLPSSWLSGTVDLRLVGGGIGCQEAPAVDGDCSLEVGFEPSPTPKITFLEIYWNDEDGEIHEPDVNLDTEIYRLIEMYPVQDINTGVNEIEMEADTPPEAGDVIDRVRDEWEEDFEGGVISKNHIYIGLVEEFENTSGGATPTPLPSKVAAAIPEQSFADDPMQHSVAHEIAHALGLGHAIGEDGSGYCGAANKTDPPVFPYNKPKIVTSSDLSARDRFEGFAALGPTDEGRNEEMWGINVRKKRVKGTSTALSTGENPKGPNGDLTSYCSIEPAYIKDYVGLKWVSDTTYTALRESINDKFSSAQPAQLASIEERGHSRSEAAISPKSMQEEEYLMVKGEIDMTAQSASFRPFTSINVSSNRIGALMPESGDYTLQMLDQGGGVVEEVSFEPRVGLSRNVLNSGSFSIPVPADPAIETAQVLFEGNGNSTQKKQTNEVIGSTTASQNPPTVDIEFPNGGEDLSGEEVVLDWSGSDPDGDSLSYTVQYSRNGGSTWKTLTTSWSRDSLAVEQSTLGATSEGLVRVQASDGFNTAQDTSDGTFTTSNVPPSASIVSPSDGAVTDTSGVITLDGSASDVEDGNLSGAALEWRTASGESIGMGETVDVPASTFPLGTQTINLVANDSLGASDTASVEVNVALSSDPALSANQTLTVESGGTRDFGDTGVDIGFPSAVSSGRVTAELYRSIPIGTDSISETNVSQYRVIIGASGGLGIGVDSADTEVRFEASTLGGIGDPTKVTIYKRSAPGNGPFAALETQIDENGTPEDSSDDEVYAVVSEFGEFVFASNSEPLPVELSGFDATLDGSEAVRLTWTTTSETNNAGFRIQRRAEDKVGTWTTVGSVEGAGTTTEARSYRFVDEELPYEADRLTYRLKQVDTDGSTSLSKEVTVERSVKEVELLGTYPNPAQQRATVRYAVPERQDVKIYLYDILGRRVQTVVNGEREGRHKRQLNVSQLASGVYFLRLRAESATKTQRLTVVR